MGNLRAGTQFNERYTIVRRLGGGGMGEVYLARDVANPDFYVAIKLIPPGVIDSPMARERFRNEIVAAYRINHPNIIKAYEYFDGVDLQAYAMEYVSGGDLLSLIKREPLTPAKSARFLNQIASALEAIHAAGIVHRDLKPENILITTDEQVKLADFGVARLRGSQTLTQAGAMVGTPKYIPPEYLETGESDHRGDIFALGVLGYEMLSGVSPFPDDSRELLAARRHTLKPPPLVKVAPHCPPELALIIERAMSPNLAQRYQSATDLRRDIERFLGDETVRDEGATIRGTDAIPFSATPLRESKSRLSPTRIIGGGAVVGLFTALIVVIAYPRPFGAVPPAEEPRTFNFTVTPSESREPIGIDPRELGLELVRIGDLERLYGELIDGGTGASLGTTSAPIKERGPQIEGEPGAVSFLKVRERRLWLEREIASLKGSGSTLSGD